MNPNVWGVFHDGTIDQIVGVVPGDVELWVDIRYLREMFGGDGSHFRIRLLGCSKLEYREYDRPVESDLQTIADKEPEVLYVHGVEPLVLDCREGELVLAYCEMEVFLDSGDPVTDEELCSASKRYWNR